MDNSPASKLSIRAFGIAMGFTAGYAVLLMGWTAWLFGYQGAALDLIGSLFIGFGPSFWGGLVGLYWGFVGGFLFGVLAAGVYNFVLTNYYADVNADS